jgi:hypothetical protein
LSQRFVTDALILWSPALLLDVRFRTTYNPPRFMVWTSTRSAVFLLTAALSGCTLFASSPRIVHQQGRTTVQLEKDASAGGSFTAGGNSHPAAIKPAQLAVILRAIQIRSEHGLVGAILSLAAPADSVFTEEEVSLLAPLLADGLAQASQSERVGFTYWSSQPGRRNAPLNGHLAVRGPYLRFGLNDHPTVGWQDPEDPSAPKLFTLEFQRETFARVVSTEEQPNPRKARPLIQIDFKSYLTYVQDQGGPPAVKASPAGEPRVPSTAPAVMPREPAKPETPDVVKELQRQVKELTDSNQELRARMKDMLDRQDQSRAVNEELTRLRQELAETKQLLADKVLELNRLKSKSGAAGKGKK